MSQPNYYSTYLKVEGGKLTLFNDTCGWIHGPDSWVIDYQEMDPCPVADKIAELIQNDVVAGRDSLIAYVGLNPVVTVQLWLEGVLTRNHIEACSEGVDQGAGYIEYYDVPLNGVSYTIRTYETPQYNMATYDAQGDVV